MYFKGTPTRGVGEIAQQTKAVGGYLNAATIYDHTSYYTVLPSSSFAAGLDVQFDAYANSLIDAEELARELEVIIQEAKRKADNPGAVATETLFELLHDRHRIRRWRIGREPGLRALTRDAMIALLSQLLSSGQHGARRSSATSIPTRRCAEIDARYGALPAGEPTRIAGPDGGGRGRASAIASGRATSGRRRSPSAGARRPRSTTRHAGPRPARARSSAAGARRGSIAPCASGSSRRPCRAYDYTPTSLGVFVVHAETPPERAADAARAIWAQLRDVRDDGVGEARARRARSACSSRAGCAGSRTWKGRRTISPSGKRSATGDGRRVPASRARRDDGRASQALARRYLDPDQAAVVVYRPTDSTPVADGRGRDARAARRRARRGARSRVAVPPLAAPAIATRAARRARGGWRARLSARRAGIAAARATQAGRARARRRVRARRRARRAGRHTRASRRCSCARRSRARRGAARLQIAEEGELLGGSVTGSASGRELRLVDQRAGALRAAGDRAARRRRAACRRFPTTRSRRSARSRSPISSRCATTCIAIRCAWRRRRRSPAIRTACRRAATSARCRRSRPTMLRAWHRARVLDGAGGDRRRRRRRSGRAGRAGGATRSASCAAATLDSLAAPSWPSDVVQRVEQREKAQTALALMFPGPSRADDARFATAMIAGVASGLGGRFFDELRDKRSLGYTVHAFATRARAGRRVRERTSRRRRRRRRSRAAACSTSSRSCATSR